MKKNIQKGVYKNLGLIKLESGDSLICENLEIPFGTDVNIYIEYEETDFKSGLNGIVWATYNVDQAETIKGALQAHKINSEIIEKRLESSLLFLIKLSNENKINEAIDFIWRREDGLNLKPDWYFPADNPNESFEKWTKNI
jgi:hypothetical protein